MKNYLKNEIKHLPFILIVFVLLYGIVTIATSYQYDSGDIKFDNTGTDLESVNVQDALDETFHHVTDYNDIKTTIGNNTLTTTAQTLTGAVNELKTDVGALNSNIANCVTGPSSVTSGTIPLYDGTTGKVIKAGKTITDVTTSTAMANNDNMPTNRTVYNAIYNGLDKNAAGFALDARQGKALNDSKLKGTNGDGNSNIEIKNVNGVVTMIFNSTSPSSHRPSLWVDINVSTKAVTFYKNIGSGWTSIGTVAMS